MELLIVIFAPLLIAILLVLVFNQSKSNTIYSSDDKFSYIEVEDVFKALKDANIQINFLGK